MRVRVGAAHHGATAGTIAAELGLSRHSVVAWTAPSSAACQMRRVEVAPDVELAWPRPGCAASLVLVSPKGYWLDVSPLTALPAVVGCLVPRRGGLHATATSALAARIGGGYPSPDFKQPDPRLPCYPSRMGAASFVRVVVDLPGGPLAEPEGALVERLRLLYVLDEVRGGRISRAGAATALGMPITAFLALAGAHGLPAFDYDIDEFERELASLAHVELRPGR